jgi:DNA-binding GntR family transcriptional regulator
MRRQNRISLADKAYEAVKRKIITLEFRPGQYLNETAVCKLLRIGRTPVHQAMHRLMLDGLVEIIPRKGVIVRSDSIDEVFDLMEARWVVEPYCAGMAAEQITAEDAEELERTLVVARQHLDSKATEGFMSMDRLFHARIAHAGNPILSEMLRTLHERSARIWFLNVWTHEDFAATQSEHEAILRAIKNSDKEGAASAMRDHLTSLRRRIIRSLDEQKPAARWRSAATAI